MHFLSVDQFFTWHKRRQDSNDCVAICVHWSKHVQKTLYLKNFLFLSMTSSSSLFLRQISHSCSLICWLSSKTSVLSICFLVFSTCIIFYTVYANWCSFTRNSDCGSRLSQEKLHAQSRLRKSHHRCLSSKFLDIDPDTDLSNEFPCSSIL